MKILGLSPKSGSWLSTLSTPITLIEMMVSGMPDISMFQFDILEVVQYRAKNSLVEERDGSGLVDRKQWLVQHPDEQAKLLRVGRKHVEVEFNVAARQEPCKDLRTGHPLVIL